MAACVLNLLGCGFKPPSPNHCGGHESSNCTHYLSSTWIIRANFTMFSVVPMVVVAKVVISQDRQLGMGTMELEHESFRP
eukprot:c2303_g1_i1 orf=127-366(+)